MSATKAPPAASTELAKLERRRDDLHAKAQAAKRQVNDWDAATEALRAELTARCHTHPDEVAGEQLRPRPGTEAARLEAEVRERMDGANPHIGEHLAAREKFLAADAALQRFRQERLRDLLAEADADFEALSEDYRAALRTLVEVGAAYGALVDRARELILATPGLDGQALSYDPTPGEWAARASRAIEDEIFQPGLTGVASWELDQHIAYAEEA